MAEKHEQTGRHRVLVVSLVFPPTGGSGVQRTSKFVKYLPEFGWEPCVWSCPQIRGLPEDQTLLRDLPDDLTHSCYPTTEWLWMLRDFHQRAVARQDDSLAWRAIQGISWRLLAAGTTVARWMIPDEYTGWVVRSVLPALAFIRRNKIRVIYSTMSPPANHLLAYLLHKITGLPWVADYRDPWIDFYHYAPATRFHDWIFRTMDQAFVRSATRVIAATPGVSQMLESHLAPGDCDKIRVIRNGVDVDDIERQRKVLQSFRSNGDRTHEFRITCVGKIEPSLIPPELREGISRFLETAKAENIPVKLRFVGLVSDEVRTWLASIGDRAEMPGYVDHDRAIRELLEADLLLFGIGRQQGGEQAIVSEGGKLFEYLGSGKPIFYSGPDRAEAAAIIQQCQAGWSTHLDPDQISGTLHYIASQWNQCLPLRGCTSSLLRPYTRRAVSAELASELCRAAGIEWEPANDADEFEEDSATPCMSREIVQDTPEYASPM